MFESKMPAFRYWCMSCCSTHSVCALPPCPSDISAAVLSVVKAAPAGADRLGDVIIDDYIRTSEPVVDYLTKYSGIAPGDLDPGVSPHNLGATPPPW